VYYIRHLDFYFSPLEKILELFVTVDFCLWRLASFVS